jgi:hypothetical protein
MWKPSIRDKQVQDVIRHDRCVPRLARNEFAHVSTLQIDHAEMPPGRQDLPLNNASRLRPALRFLPVSLVQVEQRTDRVTMGRAFRLFTCAGSAPSKIRPRY